MPEDIALLPIGMQELIKEIERVIGRLADNHMRDRLALFGSVQTEEDCCGQ